MGISSFSFLSALLWCCGFTLFGWFMRRRRFLKQTGPQVLLSFHLLGAVRLVLPVEFSITTVVSVNIAPYPLVMDNREVAVVLPVLLAVWICGSTIALTRFFLRYAKLHRRLSSYRSTAKGTHLLNQVAGKKVEARVVLSPISTVPYVFGLKNPIIVLPQSVYPIAELRDVILHEYYHIRCGHLWISLDRPCKYCWFNLVTLSLVENKKSRSRKDFFDSGFCLVLIRLFTVFTWVRIPSDVFYIIQKRHAVTGLFWHSEREKTPEFRSFFGLVSFCTSKHGGR